MPILRADHRLLAIAPHAASTLFTIWCAKFPIWRAWRTKYHRLLGQRLSHSGNVVAASKLLGHSQLTTTQRYVDHLAVEELREAVPALPV